MPNEKLTCCNSVGFKTFENNVNELYKSSKDIFFEYLLKAMFNMDNLRDCRFTVKDDLYHEDKSVVYVAYSKDEPREKTLTVVKRFSFNYEFFEKKEQPFTLLSETKFFHEKIATSNENQMFEEETLYVNYPNKFLLPTSELVPDTKSNMLQMKRSGKLSLPNEDDIEAITLRTLLLDSFKNFFERDINSTSFFNESDVRYLVEEIGDEAIVTLSNIFHRPNRHGKSLPYEEVSLSLRCEGDKFIPVVKSLCRCKVSIK